MGEDDELIQINLENTELNSFPYIGFQDDGNVPPNAPDLETLLFRNLL